MQAAVVEAKRSASQITQALGGIQNSFAGAVLGVQRFAASIGLAVGAGGLGLMLRQAMTFADELDEMSQRLGVNVEQLQALQFAARQNGTSVESLERGIRKLSDTIGEAARGEDAAIRTFRDLGVSFEDGTGHAATFIEVMNRVAQRVAAATSPVEKITLANKAFGDRIGASMIPVLEQMAGGLTKMVAAAKEAGVVIDEAMIKQAGKAKDQLDAMGTAILANLVPAIVTLSPYLISAAKGISDMAAAAGRFLGTFAPDASVGIDELTRRLRENEAALDAVRKKMSELGQGGIKGFLTEGPFKESNLRKELQELETRGAQLRAAIDAAQPKGGVVDVKIPVVGGEKALKVLEDLRRKLQDLGTEDEFAKQIVALQRDLERARTEAPQFTKEINRIGEAMVATAAETKRYSDLLKHRADAATAEAAVETEMAETTAEARRFYNEQILKDFAEEEAALESVRAEWVKYAETVIDATEADQVAIANYPTTEYQKFHNELVKINAQAEIFGADFDAIAARAALVRGEMQRLIDLGVTPTADSIRNLKEELDALKNIQLAVGGIRDVFGAFDQAITQSIAGVIQGTQTMKQAFENMGQSIALSLIQNVVKRGIQQVEKAVIELVVKLAETGLWSFIQPGAAAQAGQAPTMVGGGQFVGGESFSYAQGGLARTPQFARLAEEGPEVVVPQAVFEGLGRGGGGDVSIQIINNTPAQVQTREQETPDGRVLQFMIDNAVNSGIQNGRYDRTASTSWGVTRQAVRR